MVVTDVLLLRSIWTSRNTSLFQFFVHCCQGGAAAACLAVIISYFLTGLPSGNLVAHGLAWHGTFFLFASAYLIFRQKEEKRRLFPALIIAFGTIYFALAVDSLLYEPTALVVREKIITSSKVTKPITIVFASDLQADDVGNYERQTLQKIKEQNADLILFGGDYMQPREGEWGKLQSDWNRLFQEINLQAPLGVYAVEGNVDFTPEAIFSDTGVVYQGKTLTKSVGEIRVTFLSDRDSRAQRTIPDEEQDNKFRIILGHRPNYAMAPQEADLLFAGHTHGGQVQIPFWGLPIVTSSRPLPRSWATGETRMSYGATLIVSHGTGMERESAPRVRFHCRPDFWVIRLIPEG